MQVARASGTTEVIVGGDSLAKVSSYAPLYLTSSLKDIAFDIEELEAIALDRLKVLKAAEKSRTSNSTGPPAANIEATLKAIRAAERANGLNIPPGGNPDRESRILKDEASHFLLRLALCSVHEHRGWLLQTECDLFSSRLDGTGIDFALKSIQKANGPVVTQISPLEFEKFRTELDAVERGPNRKKWNGTGKFYKIAFEEIPSLVRNRKVFLHKGQAFVPERNILDVVASQFRSKLSFALAQAPIAAAAAERDERMAPILKSIRDHFSADENAKKSFDLSANLEKISLKELNESIPSMPLCMRNMMNKLREQHHLRHSGRMQLGVFLKGCGLSLEESLRFWGTEFGKGSINSEKFDKNYAYNIRHHYGKEGKRRNLTPFPCIKIVNERPGPGEHNGCPYREFEESRLQHALRQAGADPNVIPAIVARAKQGNFQAACGMCFAASQPGYHEIGEHGLPQYIPSHPNEYFIESRRRRFAPAEPAMEDTELDDDDLLKAAMEAENRKVQETPNTNDNQPNDSAVPNESNDQQANGGSPSTPMSESQEKRSRENPEEEQKDKTEPESNIAENKTKDKMEIVDQSDDPENKRQKVG